MIMRIQEFANRVGVTAQTLRNYDNSGKFVAKRNQGGQRFYTEDDILRYQGINIKEKPRHNVIYTRVSTRNQMDDLNDQVEFLKQYCNANGFIVTEVIKDIGSGLNYKRKKWNNLLFEQVMNKEIDTIFIAYKDRFIRFGFDWFESFCNKFGTKIVIVQNETLSPEEEVIQDLISIIHVFSCRVYGLRKYKKSINKEIKTKPENKNE